MFKIEGKLYKTILPEVLTKCDYSVSWVCGLTAISLVFGSQVEGSPRVQSQPGLHREFQKSLNFFGILSESEKKKGVGRDEKEGEKINQ